MVPIVVGFDLDLTLVDSRPGIVATYRALSARTGVYIDADSTATRLGPPLDVELALWFPAGDVVPAANQFREIYRDFAITTSPALPGATEAFAAVRARGGTVVVITGKYEPNARRHLDHLGLDADAVVGWAWADGKVSALEEHGATVYVGDHPADMAAARAARLAAPPPPSGPRSQLDRVGAAAVGVGTGEHSVEELIAGGADVVLPDLTHFPAWLDEYLAAAAALPGRS